MTVYVIPVCVFADERKPEPGVLADAEKQAHRCSRLRHLPGDCCGQLSRDRYMHNLSTVVIPGCDLDIVVFDFIIARLYRNHRVKYLC